MPVHRRGGRPRLSIWIRFHRDERLVRRVAEAVRLHADELVVAADERVPAERLAIVAAAEPDRILRVPPLMPAERAVAWIQEQCRGRWALRLDGDELPAAALLEELPRLVADDRFSHYQIPRTWLWGEPGLRLDQRPWWPDHQARLTRNDAALTHIPGTLHTCAEGVGPTRFLETPIHHLVFLLENHAERRRRADSYEQSDPGRTMLGRPFNDAYYLPEELPEPPAVAPLAPADADLVASVLGGSDDAPPAQRLRVPRPATADEVDGRWAARPWVPQQRRARLIATAPPALPAGSEQRLRVRVEQQAEAAWPGGWPDGPRVTATWSGANGDRVAGGAAPMPGPLAPGMTTDLQLPVEVPGTGRWTLIVALLDPHGAHVASASPVDVEVRDDG